MYDQNLIVAGIEITLDAEGRYNLNALHRAYEAEQGSEQPAKAPAKWTRTATSQEFVSEVEKQTGQICIVSTEGRNGGTFAHELVAVEYAGWISPRFRILVNQTFIDHRKDLAPKTPGEALVEMAQNFLRHERQLAALAVQQATLQAQQNRTAAQVAAIVHGEQYFTIVGFANYRGFRADDRETAQIGKLATSLCKQRGVHIGKAPHPTYGVVNTYPVEICEEACKRFMQPDE